MLVGHARLKTMIHLPSVILFLSFMTILESKSIQIQMEFEDMMKMFKEFNLSKTLNPTPLRRIGYDNLKTKYKNPYHPEDDEIYPPMMAIAPMVSKIAELESAKQNEEKDDLKFGVKGPSNDNVLTDMSVDIKKINDEELKNNNNEKFSKLVEQVRGDKNNTVKSNLYSNPYHPEDDLLNPFINSIQENGKSEQLVSANEINQEKTALDDERINKENLNFVTGNKINVEEQDNFALEVETMQILTELNKSKASEISVVDKNIKQHINKIDNELIKNTINSSSSEDIDTKLLSSLMQQITKIKEPDLKIQNSRFEAAKDPLSTMRDHFESDNLNEDELLDIALKVKNLQTEAQIANRTITKQEDNVVGVSPSTRLYNHHSEPKNNFENFDNVKPEEVENKDINFDNLFTGVNEETLDFDLDNEQQVLKTEESKINAIKEKHFENYFKVVKEEPSRSNKNSKHSTSNAMNEEKPFNIEPQRNLGNSFKNVNKKPSKFETNTKSPVLNAKQSKVPFENLFRIPNNETNNNQPFLNSLKEKKSPIEPKDSIGSLYKTDNEEPSKFKLDYRWPVLNTKHSKSNTMQKELEDNLENLLKNVKKSSSKFDLNDKQSALGTKQPKLEIDANIEKDNLNFIEGTEEANDDELTDIAREVNKMQKKDKSTTGQVANAQEKAEQKQDERKGFRSMQKRFKLISS